MTDPDQNAGGAPAVATRWPEVIVATLLMIVAALVIADSVRIGNGWGDDGPKSGYFPFYIGLVLLGASAWILLTQIVHWRRIEAFAAREQLRSVLAILLPMVVYVAAVRYLGIYLASAVLIGYFMVRHGKHRVATTVLVAIGVPVAFFAVFERWFLVPLPKGPIEALLGF